VSPAPLARAGKLVEVALRSGAVPPVKRHLPNYCARAGADPESPPECVEYIVLHELVHLLARRHDERFFALMDRHLPAWRGRRELLNAMLLPHVVWPC